MFAKTITIAAALAMTSLAAAAADLPVKANAPYLPTTDPFTGFYLGVNGGYGFDLGAFGIGPATINDLAGSPQGFVGGLQAGLGGRFGGNWYAGIEGDIDAADVNGTGTMPGVISASSKNTFLGSARGRLGFIFPTNAAMVYGTVGWGFGGGEFTVTDLVHGTNNTVNPTMNGVVWGGGVELAITSNWIGRLEYLQYDFGTLSATAPGTTVLFTQKDRIDVVRGGLSYKF